MTDPSQGMALSEWLALFGVKIATLVAGFFGATVAVSGTPKLTIFQLAMSILTGVAFAVYVEPIASHLLTRFFTLPPTAQNGVAFILGLGGVVACAGIIQFVRALPDIAISWAKRKGGGE